MPLCTTERRAGSRKRQAPIEEGRDESFGWRLLYETIRMLPVSSSSFGLREHAYSIPAPKPVGSNRDGTNCSPVCQRKVLRTFKDEPGIGRRALTICCTTLFNQRSPAAPKRFGADTLFSQCRKNRSPTSDSFQRFLRYEKSDMASYLCSPLPITGFLLPDLAAEWSG